MSGRVRWQRDGETVVGHRKTDRRQAPKKPVLERLHDLNLKRIRAQRSPGGAPTVHMAFLLPKSLQGFVRSGQHGIGVTVHAKGFVEVTSYSAEQCFALARDFFADVARDRPAFTMIASIISSRAQDQTYGRHLTVVSGALVVCAGYVTPKVFEVRA